MVSIAGRTCEPIASVLPERVLAFHSKCSLGLFSSAELDTASLAPCFPAAGLHSSSWFWLHFPVPSVLMSLNPEPHPMTPALALLGSPVLATAASFVPSLYLVCTQDRALLYSLAWPRTCNVEKAVLKLRDTLASAS